MSLNCAFTGHRVLEKNFDEQIVKNYILKLIGRGVDKFYCGMAKGFDLVCGNCVLELKKQYPIKLIACVPCPFQDKYFSETDKLRYRHVKNGADEVKIIAPRYYDGCMQERNRYMVDNSDIIFCYLLRSCGGTYYTVNYAKSQGKEIILY